jgi:hypothetical protein
LDLTPITNGARMSIEVAIATKNTFFSVSKLVIAGAVAGLALVGFVASVSAGLFGLSIIGRIFTTPLVEAVAIFVGGVTAFLSSKK